MYGFYKDLYTIMSSGPVIAMVLQKDNAVEEFRNFIGATKDKNYRRFSVLMRNSKKL